MMRSVTRHALKTIYALVPYKREMFSVARRYAKPPKDIYRHLHFNGEIDIPVGSMGSFRAYHYGYQVENDLFWAGYGNGWEATSLRIWALLARRATTVLDIGANTGAYALAASAINRNATVLAFEPVERIASRLRHNIALNKLPIEVVVAGVSATTGNATFYEPVSEHAYSASLSAAMLGPDTELREITITTTRIDDLATARGLGPIDLVKVDAEKHEIEVLQGFGELIARDRPSLLIEVLDTDIGDAIVRQLAPHGYAFYSIIEGIGVEPTQRLGSRQRNYLICRPEQAQAIGISGPTAHEMLEI